MNDTATYEFPYMFGKCTVSVDGETLSFKGPGLRSGSVRRAQIVAWALNDASNDFAGVHHDWNLLARVGGMAEIFIAWLPDPTTAPKLVRVPLDVMNGQCQALIQRLRTEMPDRFRGMGSGRALRQAVGASDMGKVVLVSTVALLVGVGVIIASIMGLSR